MFAGLTRYNPKFTSLSKYNPEARGLFDLGFLTILYGFGDFDLLLLLPTI
jgi:hypothetical protein